MEEGLLALLIVIVAFGAIVLFWQIVFWGYERKIKKLTTMTQHIESLPVQEIVPSEAEPEDDLDELIRQEIVNAYETYKRPDYIEENTIEAVYDFDKHIARHFAEWGAEHLKR